MRTLKLAKKKLKKADKWIKKFGDYDIAHLDGTLKEVKNTRKICKMIIKLEEVKKRRKIK